MFPDADTIDSCVHDTIAATGIHLARLLQRGMPADTVDLIEFVADFCVQNSRSFAPWVAPILIQLDLLRISDTRFAVRGQAGLAIDRIIDSIAH